MMQQANLKNIFVGLIVFSLIGPLSASGGEYGVFSGNEGDYQYPIGIPELSWSDGETYLHPLWSVAPENWQTAKDSGVNAYYIDNTHVDATNSSNEFGSPEKPRSTIPEITYAAGSYVEIHGGPYVGGGQIIFTAEGTVDKPVWFRGLSKEDAPEITGTTIVKGQYIFLENLRYTSKDNTLQLRTSMSSNLHHAVVRNSVFEGQGEAGGNGSAIAIYGESPENRFHDIVVFNNKISNMGNSYSDTDMYPPGSGLTEENDFHGILVRSNVDRAWVLNNEIYELGGDSVQVGVASTGDENRASHTYIGGNKFYRNLENGVDVKEADHTIVSENNVYDWVQHKDNSSTGGAVVIHNNADNTWVINNIISNAASGVAVTGGSTNTWIVGNIIENIKRPDWDSDWNATSIYSSGPAIHFRGSSSGGAVNNTIKDASKPIEMSSGSYSIINNIIYERNESAAYDIQIQSTGTDNVVSNNLIYNSDGSIKLEKVTCLYCLYDDPKFSNDNYVTDVGIALGNTLFFKELQATFKDNFGMGIEFDIAGNQRVRGGIDVGVYENESSTEEAPLISLPAAPVIEQVTSE